MLKRKWLLLLWVLAIVLALTIAPRVSLAGPSITRELVISAKSFQYSPAIIRVNQGDVVRVTIKAEDVSHGFYLDGYDVDVVARPKEDAHTEFVADKVGKFRFRCSVTCGSLHPFMIGELVVEPNSPLMVSLGLTALTALGTLTFLGLRKEQ